MKCPQCHEDRNEVKQTHSDKNFMMKANMRTRLCHECGYLFDTEETAVGEPYKIIDKQKIKTNQKDMFTDEED
ncbi:MAG: hypothetical protein JJ958_06650 [Balneola sp.]|nr:hypothetical protein [Balneola sp.]